ncbi:hypothetical protein BDV29DRAFT_169635 [Aspergillus leporis]|uniref:Uncharacterized protein n=1 Tax=Aspergillus leporis TaxID=41062 RepID=A0A5N5X9G5_9EURO|nr:hypothetical protein BDV29DRAFT_169635 [Aspergillus leporis]
MILQVTSLVRPICIRRSFPYYEFSYSLCLNIGAIVFTSAAGLKIAHLSKFRHAKSFWNWAIVSSSLRDHVCCVLLISQ